MGNWRIVLSWDLKARKDMVDMLRQEGYHVKTYYRKDSVRFDVFKSTGRDRYGDPTLARDNSDILDKVKSLVTSIFPEAKVALSGYGSYDPNDPDDDLNTRQNFVKVELPLARARFVVPKNQIVQELTVLGYPPDKVGPTPTGGGYGFRYDRGRNLSPRDCESIKETILKFLPIGSQVIVDTSKGRRNGSPLRRTNFYVKFPITDR